MPADGLQVDQCRQPHQRVAHVEKQQVYTSRGASGVTIMVPTAAISVRFKKSVAVEATLICLPPGKSGPRG